MTTGIIILALTLIIGTCVVIAMGEEFTNGTMFGMIITLGLIIGVCCIYSDTIESTPSAMDVYQGKTTLEITYKDGVPVDSVVVFKD